MPTTAAIIAGTGASLAGIGTVVWTLPGNITASDDTRTTAAVTNAVSRWLVATNFDFSSIPSDAVILGMTGTLEGSYTSGTGVTLTAASFVVGNAVVGVQISQSQAFTTSDANYTVDLSPGVIGYSVTPALLQTSTTGWAVSVTGVGASVGRIDAMWLTVVYGYNGFRTRITTSTLSNRLRRPLMAIRS